MAKGLREIIAKRSVEARSAITESPIWQKFISDQDLLSAHEIRSEELDALSRVAMCGSVHSKSDLIFILNAFRRAHRS